MFRKIMFVLLPVSLLFLGAAGISLALGALRTGDIIVSVVTSPRQGNYRFVISDLDTRNQISYRAGSNISNVVLSPNGRRALIMRRNNEITLLDLMQRQDFAFFHYYELVNYRWSPDSERLMFITLNNDPSQTQFKLHIMDFAQQSTDVVFSATSNLPFTWQPSGRFAFSHASEILDQDRNKLTDGQNPIWSPDGRYIAYLHQNDVYLFDTFAGEAFRLTQMNRPMILSGWSPDSQWLSLYTIDSTQQSPYTVNVYTGETYAYDIPPADFVRSATWSQDSRQVAIVVETLSTRNRQSQSIIYVTQPDGQNAIHITDNGYAPMWSPDGKNLLYQAWQIQEGRSNNLLFSTPVDDPQPQLITRDVLNPVWSADGQRVYYIHYEPFGIQSQLLLKDRTTTQSLSDDDEFVRTFASYR